LKIKLDHPLLAGTKQIDEIELKKEDFTGDVIETAEQMMMYSGKTYNAIAGMAESNTFLSMVASIMAKVKVEDLRALPGEKYLEICDTVKGFFGDRGSLRAAIMRATADESPADQEKTPQIP